MNSAVPAGTDYLVVESQLIGMRRGVDWHKVGDFKARKQSITFHSVEFGPSSKTLACPGFRSDEAIGGVFIENTDVPDHVLFSGTAKWPRPVKTLSNSNPGYLKVVGEYLRSHGIRTAPRITRVVSVDLDGDGTQELILQASNRDDLTSGGMHGGKGGDYSLVLLRYLRNGRAVNLPIEFEHPKSEDMNYLHLLRAVADFDGDGVMEFVVTSQYYEGGGAELMRFRHGKLTKLVEDGAGA